MFALPAEAHSNYLQRFGKSTILNMDVKLVLFVVFLGMATVLCSPNGYALRQRLLQNQDVRSLIELLETAKRDDSSEPEEELSDLSSSLDDHDRMKDILKDRRIPAVLKLIIMDLKTMCLKKKLLKDHIKKSEKIDQEVYDERAEEFKKMAIRIIKSFPPCDDFEIFPEDEEPEE